MNTQHTKFSGSNINPQSATTISSPSGLTRWSRSNQLANLPHLDIRVKPEYDSIENTGRSMVEMLGVLAIIGVLSVGAIAGYSKAMMKYKVNQHAEAVNMLINNALQIKDKLEYTPNTNTYYGTLFYKLNLLPDGIRYIRNDLLEESWFKGNIAIYYNNTEYSNGGGRNSFGQIYFQFSPSAQGVEICRNIIIAAKENASNLIAVSLYQTSEIGRLWGNTRCSSETECLHSASITKIHNLCNACDDGSCRLFIIWK